MPMTPPRRETTPPPYTTTRTYHHQHQHNWSVPFLLPWSFPFSASSSLFAPNRVEKGHCFRRSLVVKIAFRLQVMWVTCAVDDDDDDDDDNSRGPYIPLFSFSLIHGFVGSWEKLTPGTCIRRFHSPSPYFYFPSSPWVGHASVRLYLIFSLETNQTVLLLLYPPFPFTRLRHGTCIRRFLSPFPFFISPPAAPGTCISPILFSLFYFPFPGS